MCFDLCSQKVFLLGDEITYEGEDGLQTHLIWGLDPPLVLSLRRLATTSRLVTPQHPTQGHDRRHHVFNYAEDSPGAIITTVKQGN